MAELSLVESLRLDCRPSSDPGFMTENTVVDETLTALATMRHRGRPSLDRVARLLDKSPRTLQRQLRQHGVSFSELLQDFEEETAKQLLANRNLPIAMIGASLGYRDPSSFSRAFRRWTGLSAREFRVTSRLLVD